MGPADRNNHQRYDLFARALRYVLGITLGSILSLVETLHKSGRQIASLEVRFG